MVGTRSVILRVGGCPQYHQESTSQDGLCNLCKPHKLSGRCHKAVTADPGLIRATVRVRISDINIFIIRISLNIYCGDGTASVH